MPSGDMWWAKSVVTQTNNPPDVPVPGFTWKFVPTGVEFSGVVIGPPGPLPPSRSDWRVEIRSDYFLDPPRMPATGEAFISLPKMAFDGSLGLAGGAGELQFGDASCTISFRQILWRESEEVASSEIEWLVGGVRGKQTLLGKNVLTPQNRDYGALFFNLDRTRSLYITLVTTFFFSADFGGVIGFGGVSGIPPLVVGTPQWKIYAPD